MSPLKAVQYLVCNRYKWLIIKIVLAVLLLIMVALFIYSMPGYLVKKMLGAWRNRVFYSTFHSAALHFHSSTLILLYSFNKNNSPLRWFTKQHCCTSLKNLFIDFQHYVYLPINKLFPLIYTISVWNKCIQSLTTEYLLVLHTYPKNQQYGNSAVLKISKYGQLKLFEPVFTTASWMADWIMAWMCRYF